MTLNVDVSWSIRSTGSIPIHHQYPLLSAVSRVLPDVHRSREFGVHPIQGIRESPGRLKLLPHSVLKIRTRIDNLPTLMLLSGKRLDLAGCPVRLGVPHVIALSPYRSLDSQLVTIKGYMEEQEFGAALRRQLDALEISGSVNVEVGARKVLRIKQQIIVGFKVRLDQLSDHESVRIQASGLGGRRHFGCGLFNSFERKNELSGGQ